MGHHQECAIIWLLVALAAIATCALAYISKLGALHTFDHECVSHAFTVSYVQGVHHHAESFITIGLTTSMQAWEDYRSCATGKCTWPSCRNNTLGCFHEYLLERFHHQEAGSGFKSMPTPPWHDPSSCAVLLEFRPLEDRLKWSITNALDNLPVPWCI